MSLSSQFQSDRSILPLLLSNLLTLVWAVAEGWQIIDVMLVYWVQSVVIGYYNYHRIMDLKKFSTENFTMNNRRPDPTPETQKKVAVFFALHYGTFHAAYLAFILGRDSGEISMSSIGLIACIVAFVLNHQVFLSAQQGTGQSAGAEYRHDHVFSIRPHPAYAHHDRNRSFTKQWFNEGAGDFPRSENTRGHHHAYDRACGRQAKESAVALAMYFRIAADLILASHLIFIVFVILGGLLALRWRWLIFVHIPAAVWGAFVEISGRICPLTIWENQLRQRAGYSGYTDSFVEHYLLPVIYPAGLTRNTQIWIAGAVILVNVVIYGWLVYRLKQSRTMEISS